MFRAVLGAGKVWKIQLYSLLIIIFGFLFNYFYQTMIVEDDFIGVNYNINLSEKTDCHNLLSGWSLFSTSKLAWAAEKQAAMLIKLPSAKNCRFTFEIFAPADVFKNGKDCALRVILNDSFKKKFQIKKRGWSKLDFIAPKEILKQGFNKIKITELPSKIAFKTLVVSNYQIKRLLFLRSYMLWETVRLFGRMSFEKINLVFGLISGFILLGLWVFYSLTFRSFTKLSLTEVLNLDFWSYVFALLFLLLLYAVKLVSFYNPFYYKLDFWLSVTSIVLAVKIIQIFLYADKDAVKQKIKFLGNLFIKWFGLTDALDKIYKQVRLKRKTALNIFIAWELLKYLLKKTVQARKFYADIFITTFMALFFFTWPFLYFNKKDWAEQIGNWAFLFLAMGIILKLVEYIISPLKTTAYICGHDNSAFLPLHRQKHPRLPAGNTQTGSSRQSAGRKTK